MLKYIRKNKKSFTISKSSKSYGNFKTLDDAIFIRDLLIKSDWKPDSLETIYKKDDYYLVIGVFDEKVSIISKYTKKPSDETVEKQIKKFLQNPNNSRYGLNITKVFDTFIIKKQIAGDDYIFGYYDKLSDARFVRNFLLNHNWDVSQFGQIEFDEDTNTYKVLEVIDDKVYVIDEAKTPKVDLKKSHEKFLTKISKHKHGLSNHDYLDELVDKIDYLKELYDVMPKDDNWNLDDISNPLNESIFNLTPWQKIVYDAIDEASSFDEIKKKLSRYKSKNFENKINKNLNDLCDLNLILKNKNGEFYKI